MGDGAEFDAIRRMLALWGNGARGIGDDAAVLDVAPGEQLVVSTDATVEGVHFRRGWLTGEEIGGRAAAAALSDLAAMGAHPIGLLLALALPDEWRADLDDLSRGVGRVAGKARCPIVGGNVSKGTALSLTITVLGQSAHPLRRSGARAGDSIFVTGRLGGPGAALRALLTDETPTPLDRQRFACPAPRIAEAAWLASRGATSAIDISDGLTADAAHVARASGVTMEIDARALPVVAGVEARDALMSGEEYELLVTSTASFDVSAFEREFGVPLTNIGVVTEDGGSAVRIIGASAPGNGGHDHFAQFAADV